jgi:hypothetical protein
VVLSSVRPFAAVGPLIRSAGEREYCTVRTSLAPKDVVVIRRHIYSPVQSSRASSHVSHVRVLSSFLSFSEHQQAGRGRSIIITAS